MLICNITLLEDLLLQLEELARAEQSIADAIAAEAVRHHIARRFGSTMCLGAARRGGTLNDDQVELRQALLNQEIKAAAREFRIEPVPSGVVAD